MGFEGWHHYPLARNRLLRLLNPYKKRVVLLSGDVHFAEALRREGFAEVTSSGITHTPVLPGIIDSLVKLFLGIFGGKHRWLGPVLDFNFATFGIDEGVLSREKASSEYILPWKVSVWPSSPTNNMRGKPLLRVTRDDRAALDDHDARVGAKGTSLIKDVDTNQRLLVSAIFCILFGNLFLRYRNPLRSWWYGRSILQRRAQLREANRRLLHNRDRTKSTTVVADSPSVNTHSPPPPTPPNGQTRVNE